MASVDYKDLAALIDHTMLDQGAPVDHVRHAAQTAIEYHTRACCLRPHHLGWVLELLRNTQTRPCAAVGFGRLRRKQTKLTLPHELYARYDCGTEDKIREIAGVFVLVEQLGLSQGVEFDFPVNLLWYMRGDHQAVRRDLEKTIGYIHQRGRHAGVEVVTKLIGENALLTDDQKREIYTWAKDAGADMVKTSTGFTLAGATVEDIHLMREVVGPQTGVKASGGVTQFNYRSFINAGVNRIGTSKGMEIMEYHHGRSPSA